MKIKKILKLFLSVTAALYLFHVSHESAIASDGVDQISAQCETSHAGESNLPTPHHHHSDISCCKSFFQPLAPVIFIPLLGAISMSTPQKIPPDYKPSVEPPPPRQGV